jgi:K+-transporting ATPase ATPase B chain
MTTQAKKISLLEPAIVVPAIGESFRKLDPRTLARNPVMFAVEIVAAAATILFLRDLFAGGDAAGFTGQITIWLWFTVLFANFAEAVAEGRGKAQANTLRRMRSDTIAKVLVQPETDSTLYEKVRASDLQAGQMVRRLPANPHR